jgi:hypothetical protein
MLTPREDSSGAPFFRRFSRRKENVNRPTLGSRKKDSSSVGMTNKVEIMKILNLRRFENGED